MNQASPPLRLFGTCGSSIAHLIRDFLYRSDVPFSWVELVSDEHARAEMGVDGLNDRRLPICLFPDGTRLEHPSFRHISEKLGWIQNLSRTEYDVAIYGGGPAGLSAAVYCAAESLKTVLIERFAIGGQATSSPKIENYLGFPNGISGADLAERAREQACRFGVEIMLLREGVIGEFVPGRRAGYLDDGTNCVSFTARASICATGQNYRRLGLPNEDWLVGGGVCYGAGGGEAPLCENTHVLVVGGGNSAAQSALHFASYASKVTIVIAEPSLDQLMSVFLADRIRGKSNIDVKLQTKVTALHGDSVLHAVTLTHSQTGEIHIIQTPRVFLCLGGTPNTQWAGEIGMMIDPQGYIFTGTDLICHGKRPENWKLDRDPYLMETNLPGVFAAGDVRHGSAKQFATAVGEGAMASKFVRQYLAAG
ncbi:MAG: FAD-dependent oxidoreductase [Alphaproteobacteria bacterium]